MSKELIELTLKMDQKELNTQIAVQCAPLLSGVKISNILIVEKKHRKEIFKIFSGTRVSVYLLCASKDKVIFLLYHRPQMEKLLLQKEARKLLLELKYTSFRLGYVLREHAERYERYMKDKEAFPHEMGLLLGYPIEDIRGFMDNDGQNFLYTGYWKVYENLSEKLIVFETYHKAKEQIMRMVCNGIGISAILNLSDCLLEN